MEWINILKRKRSKHHSPRKFRRGRNVHQRFHRPKGGVPMVGAIDDPKLEAREDKPMPITEAELADKNVEELREMLNSQIESMDKKEIMNLLVRWLVEE